MECKLFKCEVDSCNACGQDECLPARQFNRTVEIAKERAEMIAAHKRMRRYYREFNEALEGLLGARFGGGR